MSGTEKEDATEVCSSTRAVKVSSFQSLEIEPATTVDSSTNLPASSPTSLYTASLSRSAPPSVPPSEEDRTHDTECSSSLSPDNIRFRFSRTASFWNYTAFLEGSIVFTITSTLGFVASKGHILHDIEHSIVFIPNVFGALLYTFGAYLNVFQLINFEMLHDESFNIDDLKFRYWVCNWKPVIAQAGKESCIGILSYFVGALLFQVGCCAAVFTLGPLWEKLLVGWTGIIASVLFCVGAFMELLENDCFCNPKPATCMFWVCVFYSIGGINFLTAFVASVLGCFDPLMYTVTPFVIGSAAYGIGSLLLCVLWEDKQFRHVRALVSTRRQSSREDKHSFSHRGLFFHCLYAFAASVAIVNLSTSIDSWARWLDKGWNEFLIISSITSDFIALLLTHAAFVVSSAMSRMPHAQPWRCLMIFFRMTLLIVACASILRWIGWVKHLAGPPSKHNDVARRLALETFEMERSI
eukprot:gnl/MRDRNA2_/MRDRNA2_69834_c0_seq1.p1 gnl/MRDRNA2_/MRDRNA2_69834_c0~~gnl/MRDRNA2_/MRDRNA2_69834_c0_seq1.p1  ORF type:complete len:467 (-),score=54.72 gnl/MRDRNA2_/MRDRNA2_69834_c0_seq1:107-1507(-)